MDVDGITNCYHKPNKQIDISKIYLICEDILLSVILSAYQFSNSTLALSKNKGRNLFSFKLGFSLIVIIDGVFSRALNFQPEEPGFNSYLCRAIMVSTNFL